LFSVGCVSERTRYRDGLRAVAALAVAVFGFCSSPVSERPR
jgi:hypothetical protein